MHGDSIVVLAKIVNDTIRLRNEAYDNEASNIAAAKNWDEYAKAYKWAVIDYQQFNRISLAQAMRQAIAIHIPELASEGIVDASECFNDSNMDWVYDAMNWAETVVMGVSTDG